MDFCQLYLGGTKMFEKNKMIRLVLTKTDELGTTTLILFQAFFLLKKKEF